MELVIFIALIALLLWSAWISNSFRNRQLSIWSLLVLVTLLAIAWGAARSWGLMQ